MAQINAELDHAISIVGLTAGSTIAEPLPDGAIGKGLEMLTTQLARRVNQREIERTDIPSFTMAYEQYMSDPTNSWSRRTRIAHEATRRMALSIIGSDIPLNQITRAHGRDFIDVLQRIPKNASKRFPDLTPRKAADLKGPQSNQTELMSIANINAYLNKLTSFFNWAELDELVERNPLKGMRLVDHIHKKEKRKPFSAKQLRTIFNTPLYTGCVDDASGYFKLGSAKPKGSRFWIPLLGLFTGMRLNEICQLEVNDINLIDHVPTISVSANSLSGSTDKRLKTKASIRVIPIHAVILNLGFLGFVNDQKQTGHDKLFGDLVVDRNGFRSTAFSKWFIRFCKKAAASEPRTSFHSFRHNFRDAMREAEVPRDIAHAIGGWTVTSNSHEVADDYGSGYSIKTLNDAVQKVSYPNLDLSHLDGA